MTNAAVTPLPERSTDWTIGKNVHILLIRSEETQAKLAAVLGMSPQLLSHKLKGKRPWAANEIEGAARHYRVTIDSLFRKLPDVDSNHEPAVTWLDTKRRVASVLETTAINPDHQATITPIRAAV